MKRGAPQLANDAQRVRGAIEQMLSAGIHKNEIFDTMRSGDEYLSEDYAFCRNWRNLGGELLILPNLNISHWKREETGEYTEFKGNYHLYLGSRPGGALDTGETDNAQHQADWGSVRRSAA